MAGLPKRWSKVNVNMGVRRCLQDTKLLELQQWKDMTIITGQKASVTRAKKSIANFQDP